jgi:hypothetical protein
MNGTIANGPYWIAAATNGFSSTVLGLMEGLIKVEYMSEAANTMGTTKTHPFLEENRRLISAISKSSVQRPAETEIIPTIVITEFPEVIDWKRYGARTVKDEINWLERSQ